MDLLREPDFVHACAYWLVVPFYLVWCILFCDKGFDPLGKFGYSVEMGLAKYE